MSMAIVGQRAAQTPQPLQEAVMVRALRFLNAGGEREQVGGQLQLLAQQRVEIKITHCRIAGFLGCFWSEMRKISPVNSYPPCSGAYFIVH
ncbi:hypothetical protein LDFHOB_10360 [Candidatus Electronema aureum]